MKKRFILPFLLMLLFSCSTVYAANITGNEQIEEVSLTEENRYDSIYYQEPKVRFPIENIGLERSARTDITLEEHIVNALKQLETCIDVSAYQIPVSEKGTPFFQILNQHPEFFYVSASVRYSYNPDTNMITSYTVSYSGTEEEIIQQQEIFEQSVDAALEQVETSMSNVEKALVVHDYLVLNCEYDKENLDNNTVPDVSHSAYGAMVNQVAVCDGYSKAYAYIMEGKLGISCDIVSSDSMNHAWNMISIDGSWYHVDATWDDPTWDSIGRVVHNYFLISDTVISDSEHKHTGWGATNEAESVIYDTAFWSNVSSAICHQRGNWYYAKYNEASRTVTLMKKGELLGTEEAAVYTENGLWNNYLSGYMYLSPVNDKIYFNTKTSIVRMDADGSTTVVYEPDLAGKQLIFGFKTKGEELYYALQETPNLTSKQIIHAYTLPELKELEIEGISAEDVKETYNGSTKTITVNGTQAGDIISYALEGETYTTEQPEMINAGTYQVLYKVERSGYKTFYGTAAIIIEKAVPTYTVPSGLKGSSGKQLQEVELPKGFTWQADTSTVFVKEGIYPYSVTYTPEDTNNYKTVSNIEVQVAVTCPKHQYTSKITKEPTETEKGERTYTCQICEDTYKEEIPILTPENPDNPEIEGISAEDVKETYNGSTKTITVNGTQAGDIVSYALEGEEYTIEQPEITNAGTYHIQYKVRRNGYKTFYGTVTIIIEKAVPTYTVPSGLKGLSGKQLQEVELPKGFTWQTTASTTFVKEGTYSYFVIYTPEDNNNYETVSNIEVQVAVTCPKHQYTSKITKEPTETEKGERTYTCQICEDTYKEEITVLIPENSEIKGIRAADIRETYNGKTKKINVNGTQAGDIVSYALEGETYTTEQPEIINAGTYQVLYKVERSGYKTFYGTAKVTIEKAVPTYTIPTGLKGVSGKQLKDVKLPKGFTWQTTASTTFVKEGTYSYFVIYTPQDTKNYKKISNIKVQIKVTCPGHQYTSKVTKEPTETRKGQRTYTCKICKNTYTKEIAMLTPRKPAKVTGLKLSKATTNSLKFSWKKVNNVKYRVIFYKGKQKVSTKYISSNSYTYNKLKAATEYTLKITPYREVNKKKVYASSTGTVKTATKPVKATLSSVKKNGNGKAKITWKKVTGASGYEIRMKTGNGKYKKIQTISKGKTVTFTKTGLKKGKTYSFQVRAYKNVGKEKVYGDYSNKKDLKLK